MRDATAERILEHFRSRREELVDFLGELVRIESPTTEPATQGPVFDRIQAFLEEIGYRVRRYPGESSGGQLLAYPEDRRKGAPYQLVLGHVDTVWPVGTLEEMPLHVDDGKLRGPGVFDMKGGLTLALFACRALRLLEERPEATPVLFLNSDEEVGSQDSENRIRLLGSRACRTYVLEPALGLDGKIKTARKGTGHFSIRVVGKSSHAGLAPQEGVSAIQELSHVIQALHSLTDHERGITVNVGQIQGGVRTNVVAPESRAEVDVRVRTMDDGRRVEQLIHGLEPTTPGTRLEVEGSVARPPMERTARNRALWRAAREVGSALGMELEEGLSGGASDGNLTSLYCPTLDGLGPVGDGAHAAHEFVFIESIPERAALLTGLLLLPAELDAWREEEAGEVVGAAPSGTGAGSP